MTTEEAQKVLNELQEVRPEVLNDEAKRLFETIMKIVDERNLYKSMLEEKDEQIAEEQKAVEQIYADYQDLEREKWKADEAILFLTERLENSISKQKEKDKIIDLMAEEIDKNIGNTCPLADYNYNLNCEKECNDDYKKCWKQYFENKAKEVE